MKDDSFQNEKEKAIKKAKDLRNSKKVIEEIKFEPSHYQKDIYDFVQHDVGNLVVEAAAGARKNININTST